ncbi:hypothetical protein [Vibrio diazotrophicus]|uniref:hypothetical protein n=1 Tax=Vibrio diazotrophicus TaxID=685 RepID=UPI00142E4CF0|nr:hypothetical protein [Vibrio diazotrophicus]NIY91898.1 hypothetical protein [Vibrio diazotrophicus]
MNIWPSNLARSFLYLGDSSLFIHHDRLGSAIQALDNTGTQAMRLGYSPFGQMYRKHNDKTQWKMNAGVNANKQLGQLMPYQYTGGYTDGDTGLVHLDARWYNPHTSSSASVILNTPISDVCHTFSN